MRLLKANNVVIEREVFDVGQDVIPSSEARPTSRVGRKGVKVLRHEGKMGETHSRQSGRIHHDVSEVVCTGIVARPGSSLGAPVGFGGKKLEIR